MENSRHNSLDVRQGMCYRQKRRPGHGEPYPGLGSCPRNAPGLLASVGIEEGFIVLPQEPFHVFRHEPAGTPNPFRLPAVHVITKIGAEIFEGLFSGLGIAQETVQNIFNAGIVGNPDSLPVVKRVAPAFEMKHAAITIGVSLPFVLLVPGRRRAPGRS